MQAFVDEQLREILSLRKAGHATENKAKAIAEVLRSDYQDLRISELKRLFVVG